MRQTARQPNHWSEHRGCLLSAVLAEDTSVCVGGGSQELTGQLKPKQERDLMLMHACMQTEPQTWCYMSGIQFSAMSGTERYQMK